MSTREIEYFSDGVRVVGWISIPDGAKAKGPLPAVLLCSGLFGLKDWVPPRFSPSFVDAGFVTMTFDYRGFGASDGEKGFVDPELEIRDVQNSITYLSTQPEVDKDRIGILGWGLGGGVVISAAARDQRIKAVADVNGPGDYGRITRDGVEYKKWLEAQKMLDNDRIERTLTGKSKKIHWQGLTNPGGLWSEGRGEEVFFKALDSLGQEVTPEFTMSSADALYSFQPEREVARVSPRPLLIVHGAENTYMPVDEAKRVYELASEPKTLMIIADEGHLELIEPGNPRYLPTVGKIVEWFRGALVPEP